jgi:tRNA threonylcarbamoyladenosine dehydratase
MGMGNKINPQLLKIMDISKSRMCPVAKVIRKELKCKGLKKLMVCCSEEKPMRPIQSDGSIQSKKIVVEKTSTRTGTIRRQTPGSISFMPSTAGLLIAGEVVRNLTGIESLHI